VEGEVRLLGPGDDAVLGAVAAEVFDRPVRPELVAEFLASPNHHIAVALDNGVVVGMASALHYVHPDKPAQMWINEVGVVPGHRGRGLGRRLLDALLEAARGLGCREAWVLTERDNAGAIRLYAAAGGREPAGEPAIFSFALAAPEAAP